MINKKNLKSKKKVSLKKNKRELKFNFVNFIYKNFLDSLNFLKSSKNYIFFSVILFFLVTLFGYFFPVF